MSGKDRILQVAEDLFVEKGFTGTSMNEIAEKAGVAKSLIYHHYASKKALWQAMIREYHDRSGVLEKFYDTISCNDPEKLVELVVGRNGFFDFLRNNPRIVRLFSWLNLEKDFEPEYPEDEIRTRVIERVRELQTEGRIRSDIEPGLVPIVFVSLMMNWFAAKWSLVRWLGTGIPEEGLDDAFIAGAVDILLKGILPDAKA